MAHSALRGEPPRKIIWGGTISLGVAALVAFATPAHAEDHAVVAATAPANTSKVWIDIEGMGLTPAQISAKYRTAGAWHDVSLRTTTFGVSAIVDATAGPFEVSVISTQPSNPDVALTFVSGDSAVVSASSKRVVLVPADKTSAPPPSSQPTTPPDSGNGSLPDAPAPDRSESPAAEIKPVESTTGQEDVSAPAPRVTGNLSDTGFTPGWLLAGCGVLFAGASMVVLSRRRKGARA